MNDEIHDHDIPFFDSGSTLFDDEATPPAQRQSREEDPFPEAAPTRSLEEICLHDKELIGINTDLLNAKNVENAIGKENNDQITTFYFDLKREIATYINKSIGTNEFFMDGSRDKYDIVIERSKIGDPTGFILGLMRLYDAKIDDIVKERGQSGQITSGMAVTLVSGQGHFNKGIGSGIVMYDSTPSVIGPVAEALKEGTKTHRKMGIGRKKDSFVASKSSLISLYGSEESAKNALKAEGIGLGKGEDEFISFEKAVTVEAEKEKDPVIEELISFNQEAFKKGTFALQTDKQVIYKPYDADGSPIKFDKKFYKQSFPLEGKEWYHNNWLTLMGKILETIADDGEAWLTKNNGRSLQSRLSYEQGKALITRVMITPDHGQTKEDRLAALAERLKPDRSLPKNIDLNTFTDGEYQEGGFTLILTPKDIYKNAELLKAFAGAIAQGYSKPFKELTFESLASNAAERLQETHTGFPSTETQAKLYKNLLAINDRAECPERPVLSDVVELAGGLAEIPTLPASHRNKFFNDMVNHYLQESMTIFEAGTPRAKIGGMVMKAIKHLEMSGTMEDKPLKGYHLI